MTSWKSRARLGIYTVLSTITLSGAIAACGGADPASDAGTADDGDGSWTSPLEEYVGGSGMGGFGGAFTVAIGGGGPDAEDDQKMRQVEDETAACMRDEGFEYVPFMPDDDLAAAFEEAESLDPVEYARTYGYGISTLGFGGATDEEEDPNEAIREGLSATAQEAYDQALWGDMGGGMIITEESGEDDSADDGSVTSESEQGEPGCRQTASEQVYGPMDDQMVDFSEFSELFEDLRALEERITSDPDVAAAVKEWSSCMADAGFADHETLDSPQVSIMDRMSELLGVGSPEGTDDSDGTDGSDGPDADGAPEAPDGPDAGADAGAGDESGDKRAGAIRLEPSSVDEEELAKLKDDEIATAVADRECRAEHVDTVERDVRGAMEQEFVDANRDILERYRDETAGALG